MADPLHERAGQTTLAVARPSTVTRVAAGALLGLVLVVTLFSDGVSHAGLRADQPRLVVTRAQPTTGQFARGCSVRRTARSILRLFAAYNRGEIDSAMKMISPTGTFHWFTQANGDGSVGGSPRGSRRALRAYFEERHAAGERWVLVMAELFIRTATTRELDLGVQYRRVAPDLPPGAGGRLQIADAKVSIEDCRDGRVAVWASGLDLTLGRPYSQYTAFNCPRPTSWDPERVAVACAS